MGSHSTWHYVPRSESQALDNILQGYTDRMTICSVK